MHIHNQDRTSGQPFSSNCCHPLATPSSLNIAMTHHLVEVFSSTRSAWFVASVVSSTSDGNVTVRFVDLDDTVKQKNLPRQHEHLATFGAHVGSRLPPGFQIVSSVSRPGQDSFLHGASGHRFATVEGAWTWYLDGRTRAQVTTQAPVPPPVPEPVVSPAPVATMEDFDSLEGLWAPVLSGALAPLSGKFVVQLAEGWRAAPLVRSV